MPVADVLALSVEDSVAHSFHSQHERLLPTPISRAVTALSPTKKEMPAAAMLLIRMERRRPGLSDKNLENGSLIFSRMFRKEDLFLTGVGRQ